MLGTIDDVLLALSRGELKEHLHPNLELKADWAQGYGQKLSALGNKIAQAISFLVVGVTNEGKAAGKTEKWTRQTEETLSQHINENLDPMQACQSITCHDTGGGWVIVVAVKSPGEVVYWSNEAYAASGTTVYAMPPEEVLRLRIQLPGLTDYSRQRALSSYDEELLAEFVTRVKGRAHEGEYSEDDFRDGRRLLQKLGIEGTQAARILFGDCSFRVVRFDHEGEPQENVRKCGLYRLLTADFASDVQSWTAKQLSGTDYPYPEKALREALANAVAHAAYFEGDGEVVMELWPEHLTIANLSVRESRYFANRWFSRSRKTINGLLMEVLRISGHVDELGRGKSLIFAESIRGGKMPPEVILEGAGRFDRWKLRLNGGTQDPKLLRLLARTRQVYDDEQRALIAHALVLWRNKPVAEIRNYIDQEFSEQFAQVLAGLEGPIFYYKDEDRITLRRWAEVLLGEGKDSKALSPGEEERLKAFAFEIRKRYHDGVITPRELRKLADMGETPSERVLSSSILTRWCDEGVVRRIGHGKYKFLPKTLKASNEISELLRVLRESLESR